MNAYVCLKQYYGWRVGGEGGREGEWMEGRKGRKGGVEGMSGVESSIECAQTHTLFLVISLKPTLWFWEISLAPTYIQLLVYFGRHNCCDQFFQRRRSTAVSLWIRWFPRLGAVDVSRFKLLLDVNSWTMLLDPCNLYKLVPWRWCLRHDEMILAGFYSHSPRSLVECKTSRSLGERRVFLRRIWHECLPSRTMQSIDGSDVGIQIDHLPVLVT